MRVALLTNIATPYRVPVWRALRERVDALHVLLCAASEANRVWTDADAGAEQLDVRTLSGRTLNIRCLDYAIHWNPALPRELAALNPSHLLVSGFTTPSYLAALRWGHRHGVPTTVWYGSHARSGHLRGFLVDAYRRYALGLADAYVTYGSLGAAHLAALGMPSARIVQGINVVDVNRWRAALARQVDRKAAAPGPLRFLFVGRLVPSKGAEELVRAFAALPADRAELRLVGYGRQESRLRRLVDTHGLTHIDFVGPTRTVEETAAHYAWADVFVMPSHKEPWGLVVNEALLAGCYVLASERAGATPDLIDAAPAPVGRGFDPLDAEAFAALLRETVDGWPFASRETLAAWGARQTPERSAERILEALRRAEKGDVQEGGARAHRPA